MLEISLNESLKTHPRLTLDSLRTHPVQNLSYSPVNLNESCCDIVLCMAMPRRPVSRRHTVMPARIFHRPRKLQYRTIVRKSEMRCITAYVLDLSNTYDILCYVLLRQRQNTTWIVYF